MNNACLKFPSTSVQRKTPTTNAGPNTCIQGNLIEFDSNDEWELPLPENLPPQAWEHWVETQNDQNILRGYLLYFYENYIA